MLTISNAVTFNTLLCSAVEFLILRTYSLAPICGMKMLVKQLENYFVGAKLSGTPCDLLVVELVVIMAARQLDQSRFTTEKYLLDRKVTKRASSV